MHMVRVYLLPCLLSALCPLGLFGCEPGSADPPGQNSDMGPTMRCSSDDDCEGQPENRACRQGRCQNPCGAGFSYVKPGEFTMGCNNSENTEMMKKNCRTDAQPEHKVTISQAYCIAKTELTVSEYRRCVGAGKCQAPQELLCNQQSSTWSDKAGEKESLPVNCLLWTEAKAACEFLGGRLPTEAEWEKAARGDDRRRFPWGNNAPAECGKGVNWGGGPDCQGIPWTAGMGKGIHAAAYSGAYDMAGNLWEWVGDYFSETTYASCGASCADPKGPANGVLRVRRGGSFQSFEPYELRTAYREFHLPETARSDMNGVRCAKSL